MQHVEKGQPLSDAAALFPCQADETDRNVSSSFLDGEPSIGPCFLTDIAPAALANRAHCSSDFPSVNAVRNAPQNVSPAPVGSTSHTEKDGTSNTSVPE